MKQSQRIEHYTNFEFAINKYEKLHGTATRGRGGGGGESEKKWWGAGKDLGKDYKGGRGGQG